MDLSSALELQPHDVVAFVGGGGKTTSILRLGLELARTGKQVLITTTTRMGARELTDDHLLVVGRTTRQLSSAAAARIQADLAHHSIVIVIGEEEPEKLIGIHPDLASDLRPLADIVLIEADGARSRPLKAPAPYEPVWPSVTTMAVAVAGIDAIGALLNPAFVHRPERVAAITGLMLGEPITPQVMTACFLHPDGLFARIPPAARRVALINKVKTETQLAMARECADILVSRNPALRVIIADVQIEAVRVW